MRYGMCVQNQQLELIGKLAEMGYDYIECRFNLFASDNGEKVKELMRETEKSNIKCEAVNCFIPGDFRLTGDGVDEKALREYIERGMSGAAKAGCQTVVFGSGSARSIPQGFDRERGMAQIEHFLRDIVAPVAEKYKITVVTEPLRCAETNSVNTVREAVKLAERVNHPCISSLADLYHMYGEGETPESLCSFDGKIKHSHIAEVTTRAYPCEGDGYDYSRFVSALEKCGCERCSVEGRTEDFLSDSRKAIELLKKIK